MVKPVHSDTEPLKISKFTILSSEKMMPTDACKGVKAQITINHINNNKLHKASMISGEFSATGWEITISGVCSVSGHVSCTDKALDYQTAFLIQTAIAPGEQYILVPDPTDEHTRCEVKLENKP